MKPKAAPAHFPYAHRSMAEVMQDEARKRFFALPVNLRKGRTVRQFGGGV